jgi:hypothetical protein
VGLSLSIDLFAKILVRCDQNAVLSECMLEDFVIICAACLVKNGVHIMTLRLKPVGQSRTCTLVNEETHRRI